MLTSRSALDNWGKARVGDWREAQEDTLVALLLGHRLPVAYGHEEEAGHIARSELLYLLRVRFECLDIQRRLNQYVRAKRPAGLERSIEEQVHRLRATLGELSVALGRVIEHPDSEVVEADTALVPHPLPLPATAEQAAHAFVNQIKELPGVASVYAASENAEMKIVTVVEDATKDQRYLIYSAEQGTLEAYADVAIDFRLLDLSDYLGQNREDLVPRDMHRLYSR